MPNWRPGWGSRLWPFGTRHENERLSALLDDELSIDEALEVTRHVIVCGRCFSEFEAIREARKALRALPSIEPPQELLGHLLAEPSPVKASPALARRLVSAAAVSIVLIAAAAFTLGEDERGTITPPVDMFVADHLTRVDDGLMLTPVDLDN
ncbi:MAG: anti-sigma factor [Nitriliruptorales bacterium]